MSQGKATYSFLSFYCQKQVRLCEQALSFGYQKNHVKFMFYNYKIFLPRNVFTSALVSKMKWDNICEGAFKPQSRVNDQLYHTLLCHYVTSLQHKPTALQSIFIGNSKIIRRIKNNYPFLVSTTDIHFCPLYFNSVLCKP